MNKQYNISILLDKRFQKVSGKYPVKLRVYIPNIEKKKLYTTGYDFTEIEFSSIWETIKPRNEYKDIRIELDAIQTKANNIAKSLRIFNFDDFERLLLSVGSKHKQDIVFFYKKVIEEYKKEDRLGTASNYNCSLNSLLKFHDKNELDFYTITPNWLNNYEKWMLEKQEQSISTVGFYLRPLRAIFNKAIEERIITKDDYPFGKNKYEIKASKNTKKALDGEQLKKLYLSEPENDHQKKAKYFWFFSYFCNGMNIKDILLLKQKSIDNDTFEFVRAKTAKTRREQQKIKVILNDFTKEVIRIYGNPIKASNNFLFSILSNEDSTIEQFNKIQAFTRFVNQHMKLFAKSIEITSDISSYWARHSYATSIIRNGGSMEFVGDALGHSNVATTKNYFAGFEENTQREMASKLMNF
jgi:site-specific recombinase XerD